MFVDKNATLSWEWERVIVRIRCNRGVPRFQKLSDARTAFVNDRRVVKINDMVMRPSMISHSQNNYIAFLSTNILNVLFPTTYQLT